MTKMVFTVLLLAAALLSTGCDIRKVCDGKIYPNGQGGYWDCVYPARSK